MSAFFRELAKFDKLIESEPQGFIEYAAFLRKLIHNFDFNGYTAELNSSDLADSALKAPNKLGNDMGRILRNKRLRIRYIKIFTAVPKLLLASMGNLEIESSTSNQAGRNRPSVKQQQSEKRSN